ncbi:MAG: helix-turn-helix domain-containing protein [Nitrososphaerales archaeon]
MCGREVGVQLSQHTVDGAIVRVCGSCSKLGKPISQPRQDQFRPVSRPPSRNLLRNPSRRNEVVEPLLELRSDYAAVIKRSREHLGLSQQQLGGKINEKTSVISQLESGKFRPDDFLIKRLSHFFKIELLVSPNDEE